ncbi:hypothetical protein FBU59_006021 [Linderina macrospora]|uniref:Uncharacterized protein n=1 Tax=Linderina macrospora TaxID=4868 RepID=A0ACC1J151_9FUNG|nr:hypothetical protein FBU59_006021 [Linderina macrospora]
MHSAESSLSTAIDVPSPREPNSGNVSDDGDDFDSVDSSPLPNNSVSRYPPVSANTLSQLREGEIGGSLGRNAGSRATRPVASSDQPQHGTIRRKLTIGSAHKQQASGDAGSSNEELTSFFQSLLGRKGGVASAAASNSGKSSPQQPPPRQLGTASLSRSSTTGSHRDVQAEFERLKTQLNRSKE